MLIALAAGVALVARAAVGRARRRARRRRVLPRRARGRRADRRRVFGETIPHFPLYLAEALLVELRRRWRSAAPAARARRGRAASLIGTVGFAAEWRLDARRLPLPWNERAAARGARSRRRRRRRRRRARRAARRGLRGRAAGARRSPGRWPLPRSSPWPACVADGLDASASAGAATTVTPRGPAPVDGADERPPARPTTPSWVTATAWQGGGAARRPPDSGVGRGRLPHELAVPMCGNVEVARARPQGPRSARRADRNARRRRHPGQGRAGAARRRRRGRSSGTS